jgi:hypothetical protein
LLAGLGLGIDVFVDERVVPVAGRAADAPPAPGEVRVQTAHDFAYCFDIGEGDRVFWVTDLGWLMGPMLICGALLLGATAVLFEGTPDYPQPDRLWALGRSTARSSPGIIRACVGSGRARRARLQRCCYCWPMRRGVESARVVGVRWRGGWRKSRPFRIGPSPTSRSARGRGARRAGDSAPPTICRRARSCSACHGGKRIGPIPPLPRRGRAI